jgi:hypothetical protein
VDELTIKMIVESSFNGHLNEHNAIMKQIEKINNDYQKNVKPNIFNIQCPFTLPVWRVTNE